MTNVNAAGGVSGRRPCSRRLSQVNGAGKQWEKTCASAVKTEVCLDASAISDAL
jgi:hypothetical protein